MSKRDARHFGARLRHALAIKGLKSTDLAELMGLDDSVISRWVNGINNPSDTRKEILAAKLGMSLDDIYALDPLTIADEAKSRVTAPGTGRRLAQSEHLNQPPAASRLLTSAVEDALAILRSLELAPMDAKVLITALLDDDPRHLEQSSRGFRQRWMQWLRESLESQDQSDSARKALK